MPPRLASLRPAWFSFPVDTIKIKIKIQLPSRFTEGSETLLTGVLQCGSQRPKEAED